MTKNLSDKQKWALALAYSYEQRHDGEPAPITYLNTVFWSDDRYYAACDAWMQARYAKSLLFQTRRLLQALIKRGLMEEAGTTIHHSGGDTHTNSGLYCPKGYTRACKTYRPTDAGRVIGKAEDEAIKASVREIEEANPRLKEIAERAKAAMEKLA
jgi:hypothetical protein